MLLKELYDNYGTWTNLSRQLDFGVSTYQLWKKKGYIPYTTQLIIEKKTNGKFMADIRHGKPSD